MRGDDSPEALFAYVTPESFPKARPLCAFVQWLR